ICVGVAGFEPTTSSSRTKHATKLRHTPREATTAYRTGGVRSQTLEAELTRGKRLLPGVPQHRQTLAVLGLVHLALGVGVAQRVLPTASPHAAYDEDDADDHQRPERQRDEYKPRVPVVVGEPTALIGEESGCGWGDFVDVHVHQSAAA